MSISEVAQSVSPDGHQRCPSCVVLSNRVVLLGHVPGVDACWVTTRHQEEMLRAVATKAVQQALRLQRPPRQLVNQRTRATALCNS